MIQSQSTAPSLNMTPDLTPLLDIIFIVMVFLLLTANIAVRTLVIDIPSTEHSEVLQTQSKQVIAVSLLKDNSLWAIEDAQYGDFQMFSNALLNLHKKFPERPLVIASDKEVAVERMLKLLAFMQQNKINATNIIMDEQR